MLGRLLAGVLIGAAAIPVPATAAAGTTPDNAASTAKTTSGATTAPDGRSTPEAKTITLVTGDQIRLTPAPSQKSQSQAGQGRGEGEGGQGSEQSRYTAAITPAPGRERVTFHTFENDGGLRIVPSDAIPLLDAGRVDAELFDVERLIADGYGDADASTLPLIVQGAAGPAARAAKVLPSIGATAIKPAKADLAAFWKSAQEQSTAARVTPAKIFLDGKVEAALDRSTAQIGAPEAWAKGLDGTGVKVAVLDTGIDATHPDLAGKIAEQANFSTSPDTVDRFGHGTHVAATIAGTGEASNKTRKGVAYGASLLVGKVLGDDGSGLESEIIAGMQWAVAEGAKVVNMSLGGGPTDGLDPMSLAVNELSESTGVLFVVAAGNDGPGESTVGTPGAAADALTVGAVDRDDSIADFSSRGPRVGDLGLKPDITAPGVDIVAARAAGTAMGTPVDDYYTAASGTSMATPHVAGAAAILAQQHPDWTGEQIKRTLVGTAKVTTGENVYAQGAGRTDLARATTQQVAGSGPVDFGEVANGTTKSRTITYRNYGTKAVTLTLTKPDKVTLSASKVAVPAGGTAQVTATIKAASMTLGLFGGWITAIGDGTGKDKVETAVGAVVNGPVHTVTVRAIGPDGKNIAVPALELRGDDGRFDTLSYMGGEPRTYELQEGSYVVDATMEAGDEAYFVVLPEVKVAGDLEIVLDARKAKPIVIETPKPAEQQTILSYFYYRETATGRRLSHGVMHFSTVEKVNVTGTKKVSHGSFEFSSRWQLVAPLVQTNVPGVDVNLMGASPYYTGTRRYSLVKWGAKDVRGKAVLIPATDEDELDQVAAAAKAGAAAAVLIRPEGSSAWTVFNPAIEDRLPIVTLVAPHGDGPQLLTKKTLDLTLTPSSPYLYDVSQVSSGTIPSQIKHQVTTKNSMRITSSYAHNGGLDWVREQRYGWRPWQDYSLDESRPVKTPSVREEWVSAGDTTWLHQVSDVYPWSTMGALQGGFYDKPRIFKAGTSSESWAAPVVRPADTGTTRTGDVLNLRVASFVDRDGHTQEPKSPAEVAATLVRNGVKIADLPTGTADVPIAAGPASFTLTVTTARSNDDWQFGTRTESVWGFGRDAKLLGIGYAPSILGVTLKPTAKLKSLKVEVSTDDGKKWKQAAVLGTTALVTPGKTPVSLRVTAKDTAGNTLTQTVIRAYGRG